ncbi:hypothetical protein BDV34DRAFT_199177 [Aspergillus parasiticus]|uniref:Uncharacterized protein n=1 Tax=Aspergillus parasiticus TaxID=5067 RepID=A0A5N6DGC2_ASPPA|nr:hypothetical protein BDV34DRAFT_199177 [Aspergillus parasiticus]
MKTLSHNCDIQPRTTEQGSHPKEHYWSYTTGMLFLGNYNSPDYGFLALIFPIRAMLRLVEDRGAEMLPLKWVAVFVVAAIFATTESLPTSSHSSSLSMLDTAM